MLKKSAKTIKKKRNTPSLITNEDIPVQETKPFIDPITYFAEQYMSNYNHPIAENKECIDVYENIIDNLLKKDEVELTNTSEDWCKECNSDSCENEDGIKVCRLCGMIYGSCLDNTAEWRFYSNDDQKSGDPSRCGLPSNYLVPDSNMGSIISCRMGESYHMKRIRQFHSWNSMNYNGRNLYRIFEIISAKAEAHGIPQMIIEHAKMLYKKVTDNQLFRGSNKEGLMAICIHKACQDKHVPRSVKEIATIFDIDDHTMTKGNRCFDKVMSFLDREELLIQKDDDLLIESDSEENFSRPLNYVERFCSKLQIPNEIYKKIVNVTEFFEENKLVLDNVPASIAASIIFMVITLNNLNISKNEISKASQISEVTIGKCYKKLLKYQNIIKKIM